MTNVAKHSRRLRVLLPTRLAPDAVGWNLGIRSLSQTLSSCGIQLEAKIFHVGQEPSEVASADVVLFSFSNPLDYRILFDFCLAAGLPAKATERADSAPVFIGGGIGLANPEPLADYLDLMIVGLDHDPVRRLLQIFPSGPLSRRSVIRELMRIPNVYVPSAIAFSFYESGEILRVHPRYELVVERELRRSPAVLGSLVSADEAVLMPDVGCKHRCSFCVIPFLYPYQEASPAELAEQVDEFRRSGVVNIKINSATATQHSNFEMLLADLNSHGFGVALGSVRVDQVTPELVQALGTSHRISSSQHLYRILPPNGAASLTFGIETGSTRLLQLLNKKLTGREINERLALLVEAGLHNVGLYLLAGIPTETDYDIRETAAVIAGVTSRLKNVAGHVYVGVNPLIPTPHTPMQRMPILTYGEFAEWCDNLSAAVAAMLNDPSGFERITFHRMSPANLMIETVAMRGDRRIGSVLEAVHAAGLWDDTNEKRMACELARNGLPPVAFHRRRIAPNATLPWCLVSTPSAYVEERAYYQREQVARGTQCLHQH